MSNQSRNLGRGLSALISSGLQHRPAATTSRTAADAAAHGHSSGRVATSPDDGPQPLEELAASIAANGVIQPILVRPVMSADPGAPGTKSWPASAAGGPRNSLP